MKVRAKRRDNETTEKLMNRFKKQTQHLRLVDLVRRKKHWRQAPSKRQIRIAALIKDKYRKQRRKDLQYQ